MKVVNLISWFYMWWHHWWHHTGFWTLPFWSNSEFMNITMNKAAPTSDLFPVFLSFYPHKNNRKSVKWTSERISKMSLIRSWFFSVWVQKSSVRKRDNSSVGSASVTSVSSTAKRLKEPDPPRFISIQRNPVLIAADTLVSSQFSCEIFWLIFSKFHLNILHINTSC